MNRILDCTISASLLLAASGLATAAHAEPLDEAASLPDKVLAEQRGGFAWQGMQISLGADVRTYLNGDLALHSTVSWTPAGASHGQAVYGALTPAAADRIVAGILTSQNISMNVGEAQVYLANEGQTALIQRTDGAIQNIVVNTANGVDIRQQVDATLDLTGYAGFAQAMSFQRMGAALGDAVGNAAIGTITH